MGTLEEPITYKVVFLDEDGTTILKGPDILSQGDYIIPPYQEPIKSPDDDWEYIFYDWLDQHGNKLTENKIISENLIYKARYRRKKHDYKKLLVKKATCTEDGYEEIMCTQCSHKKIRTIITKRRHTWKEEVQIEPTCLETGLKKYSCQNKENSYYEACNEVEDNVIIPALGHQCKISNIARSESALRRGATFVCVHEGCTYSYTLCFQGDENNEEIGEMPSIIKGDDDRWVGEFILHIGADISDASAYAYDFTIDNKKGLYLSNKGGG